MLTKDTDSFVRFSYISTINPKFNKTVFHKFICIIKGLFVFVLKIVVYLFNPSKSVGIYD